MNALDRQGASFERAEASALSLYPRLRWTRASALGTGEKEGYLAEKADHPTAWWTILVVVLFLGWLMFLVLSAVSAFLCILPIRGTARILALQHTQHFHPAAVSQAYGLGEVNRFVEDYEVIG